MSLSHEYHTSGKDSLNADLFEFLSALSKAENITNLKDEVINLKNIIIKNLQDGKRVLKCFGK